MQGYFAWQEKAAIFLPYFNCSRKLVRMTKLLPHLSPPLSEGEVGQEEQCDHQGFLPALLLKAELILVLSSKMKT